MQLACIILGAVICALIVFDLSEAFQSGENKISRTKAVDYRPQQLFYDRDTGPKGDAVMTAIGREELKPEQQGWPGWAMGEVAEQEPPHLPEDQMCVPGHIDEEILERIAPAVKRLGCVEVLACHDGVVRLHYHGLIADKDGFQGMARQWIEEFYPEVKAVYLETKRKKDRTRDGSIYGMVDRATRKVKITPEDVGYVPGRKSDMIEGENFNKVIYQMLQEGKGLGPLFEYNDSEE
mmetsp:Transcript_15961/g.24178  ORF Transcript_15961/g.24178 Transcript_15961/m.24178 type:complete len:236 (+) Transcript_15961:121-828(+)